MTDRELLELAAKAAGIVGTYQHWEDSRGCVSRGIAPDGSSGRDLWNPLTDDGDALRLAVKLGISTLPYPVYNHDERHSVMAKQRRRSDTLSEHNPTEVIEIYGNDQYAATRRAIVRAAAEIGKAMK